MVDWGTVIFGAGANGAIGMAVGAMAAGRIAELEGAPKKNEIIVGTTGVFAFMGALIATLSHR